MLDIIKLYSDNGIDFAEDGEKHCRPGWVQVPCPFCTGNPGYHLGFNVNSGYFHCWRCGAKHMDYAISRIINISRVQAKKLIKEYQVGRPYHHQKTKVTIDKKKFRFPISTRPLDINHKKYLRKRGFNPDELEEEWDLMGTGPVARLGNIDYRFRVIAPVTYEDEIVTFQGRDITGKHKLKYMACPKDREVVHHKHLVYGLDKCKKDLAVVVEGITDVWKLGPGAVATFGIEYKRQQVTLLCERFDKFVIMFDDDPQAIRQSNKLANDLSFHGKKVFSVAGISGDPGEFTKDQVKDFWKWIGEI